MNRLSSSSKIFLFGLFLLALASILPATSTAQQGLSFGLDSISVRYTTCTSENALVRFRVHNTSSQSRMFDVSFTNIFHSWYLRSPVLDSDWFESIDSVILGPGDSIEFEAYHEQSAPWTYSDTVLIVTNEGIADTLFLIAQTYTTEISPPVSTLIMDPAKIEDSATTEFEVTNTGEGIFVVKELYIDNPGWEMRNIAIGDSIMPGETRVVQLFFAPRNEAKTYSAFFQVLGYCSSFSIYASIDVAHNGLHWKRDLVLDTLRGCRRPSEYTVTLTNAGEDAKRLDSIVFAPNHEYGWTFVTERPAGVMVPSGGELSMTLHRTIHTGATVLYAFSGGKMMDSVWIRVYDSTAIPVIKNYKDTLVFNIKYGVPFTYTGTIENTGKGRYRLHSMHYSGNELWSMPMPDTVKVLPRNYSVDYTATFAGSVVPGEYAMTYTLTGIPCDTALSQTLIVRVAEAHIDNAESAHMLYIFPTVASRDIRIEMSEPFVYSVIDLLGLTHLTGKSIGGTEAVNVEQLPQGRYYVRVESNGIIHTRAISVLR